MFTFAAMMKRFTLGMLSLLMLAACGPSYQESKMLSMLERQRQWREDSAALKIGVVPSLDCLPMLVADHYGFYDSLGQDIRLKRYSSLMDIDTALMRGRVEAGISDLVRAAWMERRGTETECLAATNAHWQLIANQRKKLKSLKKLSGSMVAITRLSATDLLADHATDSMKLERDNVYKVQVNDVGIRLMMLLTDEIDFILAPEPQATAARMEGNKAMMDSRSLDLRLGAIVARSDIMADTSRTAQVEAFRKAYDRACDSINKHGAAHYSQLIAREMGVADSVARAISGDIKFPRSAKPRQKDIDAARLWLDAAERERLVEPNEGGD